MTPVEMRVQAELIRRHAAAADDPDVRAQYFKLASDWEKLAVDAEGLADNPDKPVRPEKRWPAPRRS